MMYSFSLYFCLTLSLKSEGSARLGTCVGKQRVKSMIEEDGFSCMDILDMLNQSDTVHIIVSKALSCYITVHQRIQGHY